MTENLYNGILSILTAIDLCLENKLILPALMLIYSSIDIVGSLERKEDEGTKASFTRWVDNYILKAKPLGCTALELYGARCGILHALAAESDLYKDGKVRMVIYAWGTAKSDYLKATSKLLERERDVVVHVLDLTEAFKLGLVNYLIDVNKDPDRVAIMKSKVEKVFGPLSTSVVSDFLKLFEE